MAAASIIAVLALGNFLGGLVKGITGFGSAILNLCIWIIATCVGINSGTLQQAVLTECIASEFMAVPLLFMTRAHATCDWALVLSLSVAGAVGAPIGAAMLTHLPARQVEFVVGCLMLLVILFNWLHKKPSTSQEGQGDASAEPLQSNKPSISAADSNSPQGQEQHGNCDTDLPAVMVVVAQQHDSPADQFSIQSPAALLQAGHADTTLQDSPMQERSTSRTSSCSSIASEVECLCIIKPEPEAWESDTEHAALLHNPDSSKQLPSDAVNGCTQPLHAGSSACCPAAGGGSFKSRVLSWWESVTQPERLAVLRKMLFMGSLAGTSSGIMAGLTGMGGPPVMLMFERLQVPKDTVRGTNAVCNIIQIRIFAYIAMGVFSHADTTLYIAVSAAAVIGMFFGCLAAARTNQATFSRMLTGLMVMCCVLMFASAAGIAGNRLPAEHHSS